MNKIYHKDRNIFYVHLISDATGETVQRAFAASMAQFPSIIPIIKQWTYINSLVKINDVLNEIKKEPGLILFSIVNDENKRKLEKLCKKEGLLYVSVLDPILDMLKNVLSLSHTGSSGSQYKLDDEYYSRIEALDYTMQHDDGNNIETFYKADIILIGLSRTSKTPTSIFLANKGYKVGNFPIVLNKDIPNVLDVLEGPKLIGLTKDPRYLSRIRQTRLESIGDFSGNNYSDIDNVRKEVSYARKLFDARNWSVIDVTRRSIEETSASIIHLIDKSSD